MTSNFPDESRPEDLARRGQILRLTRDPASTAKKLLGLQARARRAETDRKALAKRLAEAEKRGRRSAAVEAELRRSQSHAAELDLQLRAAREQAAKLRADLLRVRGSRAMRLGKGILAPARLARRALAGKEEQTRDAARAPEAPPTPPPAADAVVDESQTPSLTDLLHALDDAPEAGALHRALNALWFHEGEISRPAQLLATHADLLEGAPEKLRLLAAQVASAAALLERGPSVPPRAEGIAYRAEPGRVLYCVHSTPAFGTNGYAIRTGGVARGLRANGADVVVVARAGFPWDSGHRGPEKRTVVKRDGIEYVHHPGAPLNEATTEEALDEAADAFLREARRQRPEIIHAASNYLTALPALQTARRLGVPFVYEVRGIWELSVASERPGWERSERFQLQTQLEDVVLRSADRVLAITRQVVEHLVERGVERSRIDVLPNAVDVDDQLPLPRDDEYARSLALDPEKPWIGFAGSMVPYEGLDVLLRAVGLLRDRGLDFQVVLAGGGSHEPALKKLRDELGLGAMVKFLGRRPHEEMPRLLSLIDIVACPRIDETVTRLVSPLKPLEAFANGKAVVLSDLPPHRDLAGAGEERALLCKPGSAGALADSLATLLEDPERRAELARGGRLWVSRERRWERVCRTAVAAHAEARRAPAAPGRPLAELRVGLIADEFTTKTIAGAVELEPLERDGWRAQLDGLDLVLIESAWSGNGGAWHRAIGEYSAEEHADIRALLGACRAAGIPTLFWNKEDPVHTARFLPTAVLCDHIFTVDAALIRHYRRSAPKTLRTVSGMPFYAQPKIHNPIATCPDRDTVAYAGTYYGDRYPERTKALDPLLFAAKEVGLSIYDRQATLEDSPYRFPEAFEDAVLGGLPYDEVIETYRSHIAHLNVNSVPRSPTMFSRRVVEIAASGGIVLSGPSRALTELFPDAFPVGLRQDEVQGYMHLWSEEPAERRAEAWRQMRAVLRAHQVDDALVIMARAAGIPAMRRPRPGYGIDVRGLDHVAVLSQSVLPSAVIGVDRDDVRRRYESRGVAVLEAWDTADPRPEWIAIGVQLSSRTAVEDLLMAAEFGTWDRVLAVPDGIPGTRALAAVGGGTASAGSIERADVVLGERDASDDALVRIAVPPAAPATETHTPLEVHQPARLLVAGHDLKFIEPAFDALRARGFIVDVDRWDSHVGHDEARSRDALERADVVLAEWALGNAVWFAQHRRTSQRLVVRTHMQELRRPYLAQAATAGVDQMVFVSEVVRRSAILSHGVMPQQSVVIPNFVRTDVLRLPKREDAARRIGFVGIVPQMKRLDRALDVLEGVLDEDSSYSLVVRGRMPDEYPWMQQRPEELRYYEEQLARADAIAERIPGAVVFEGHGDDMADWYRGIGTVLSTSDFESFHYTVADGAASGAHPVVLAWGGSDLLYPDEWLHASVAEASSAVLAPWDEDDGRRASERIERDYGMESVIDRLAVVLRGGAR
ncbi:glycosyltransferase [Agrococcus sp. BE272]|uniref:glycosyltransferase n=1 Tax=Agrococcus sp. BE272 TaxID=2817727 RepID=UPI0028594027|nr:glycosyltransferase [Agrococcus sp. BE272]MDR7233172.1 glycosyltransferase involved in cell wall biosynthesis/spore maturation protein CgeB [Agrococcus sp. BE272]